jgi:hypothetical protein
MFQKLAGKSAGKLPAKNFRNELQTPSQVACFLATLCGPHRIVAARTIAVAMRTQ